ncbi:MAG: NAD-dependent epimerase/dehydratase family protein [Alphaproteobacteria bacterium]|nr:NAD-dependent epimerase/dehydratase family protein [Alphaproteobacteria bacterium]
MADNTRIAVTGGAGLIGSSLVDELVAAGADVVVIDDFSRGRIENLSGVEDRIEIREGDLEDPGFASRALGDRFDTVYHLASRAFGVAYSEGRHGAILQHNEAITHNLLSTLAANAPARLLVTSSSCVYPDDGPDEIPELPVVTREPEAVNWGYGWAKRMLEIKSELFARENETALTIVRPFNIYGERYHWAGRFSQAIPMLVKRVLDGENPVVVWGSGTQRRSYIHAIDCARMMHALVEAGVTDGPVNLGTRETITMLDLVGQIASAAGREPQIDTDPSKPEGRAIKSADTTRFETCLPGFKLNISFDTGLARMTGWYDATDFGQAGDG